MKSPEKYAQEAKRDLLHDGGIVNVTGTDLIVRLLPYFQEAIREAKAEGVREGFELRLATCETDQAVAKR